MGLLILILALVAAAGLAWASVWFWRRGNRLEAVVVGVLAGRIRPASAWR